MGAPPEHTGQDAFAQALLDGAKPPPADIAKASGEPPHKRFAVYRNNVVVSLIESLAAGFPTVRKLVGDEFFEAMAGVFVREHPPSSPVMLLYGAEFGHWLAHFPPAQRLPYLPDIARLEYARREAYNAQDAKPVTREEFQSFVAEHGQEAVAAMIMTPHPAMRVVCSQHPIFQIWARNNTTQVEDGQIKAQPESVLITRPDERLEMRLTPPGGDAFLRALSDGMSLTEAAIAGEARAEKFDLGLNLQGLLESGALKALRL